MISRLGLVTAAALTLAAPAAAAKDDMGLLGVGAMAGLPVGTGFPATGGGLMLNLNAYLQLDAWAMTSSVDFKSTLTPSEEDTVTIQRAVAKADFAHAGLRLFPFAGSFNLALGGGLRRLDLAFALEDDLGNKLANEIEVTSTVASWTIGNQWRWRHVYFGIDWLGLSTPLSSSASSETTVSMTGVTDDDVRQLNDDLYESALRLGKAKSAMLLLVTFGVSI